MRKSTLNVSLVAGTAGLVAVALAACSSGGNPPPPPGTGGSTLNSTNAMATVSSATAAIGSLVDATEGLGAFVPLPIPQPAGFEGEAELCPDGGSVSINVTDAEPVDELSMGDFWEIIFAGCTTGDVVIDGGYGLSIDAFSQTKSMVSFMMTFSLTSLSVTTPQGGTTQNANLIYGLDVDTGSTDGSSSSFAWTLAGSSSTSSNFGGNSSMTVLTGLDFGLSVVIDGEGVWTETAQWNATLETTDGGLGGTALMLATQEDFVFVGLDNVGPTVGVFTVAASGDTITVSATGDGVNVLLQLDQGTDGTIDFMETVAWDDL